MRWLVTLLCLVTGCGRAFFDSQGTDGGGNDGTNDASTDSVVARSFGPAVALGLAGADPEVIKGGLEVFYANVDVGGFELFVSTRNALSEPFQTPKKLDVNVAAADDLDPAMSGDGLMLFFVSGRTGVQRVYWSNRATTSNAFVTVTPVPGLESIAVLSIDLAPDALSLIATLSADFSTHNYVRATTTSTFVDSGIISVPVGYGGFPSLSSDRNDLYYNNEYNDGTPKVRTMRATYNSITKGFESPQPIDFGRSGCTTFGDTSVSATGDEIVFNCDYQLYLVTR
jgi:hypothetical protein